jgi:hypothetical protein
LEELTLNKEEEKKQSHEDLILDHLQLQTISKKDSNDPIQYARLFVPNN